MKLKLTLGIISGILLTLLNAHSLTARDLDLGTNRQPRTCTSKSAPTKGRISAAQAAIYVACYIERDQGDYSGYIRFIDILSLEVAKPRRVNGNDISYFSQVDTSQPAYDLRGNVVVHTCYDVNFPNSYKAGSNCSVRRIPQSRGTCIKDTFGEWSCAIGSYSEKVEHNMPAPQQ